MTQNNLGKSLLAVVEESLTSLGGSSKKAICDHLKKSFKMNREDIPANLIEFTEALKEIFGSGATYLEALIAQRLCEKLELSPEDSSVDLLECVGQVKKNPIPKGECIML